MKPTFFLVILLPLLAGCSVTTGDVPVDLRTLGGVSINVSAKTVTMPGWVNLQQGPLEYLICGPAGKTHESLFVSKEPPENLQAAILLLGVRPVTPPKDQGMGRPRGSQFEIWIEWEEGGVPKSVRAERLINNDRTKSAMSDVTWIFTGSEVVNGKFKANVYGSFAVTYWDPWAIFNINHNVGGDDEALSVNSELVPAEGTNVTIQFRLKKS